MVADALAPCNARSSAAMELTALDKWVSVLFRKDFNYCSLAAMKNDRMLHQHPR